MEEKVKQLTNLKDIKCLEEFKSAEIELIRGETPLDIEEKCLQLCKDYLSGNWSQQTVDTIEVRRVTGGMINQLYYCGIKEPDHSENVPQEVVVKFYGNNPFEWPGDSRILRDVVITFIFCQNKLGPKLYASFERGQILKFYKHRSFTKDEQRNLKLFDGVMRKLAKIHSLNVPIKRNHKFLFELMFKFYEEMFEKFPIKQEIDEYKCQTLKNTNLKQEIDWIIGVIERSDFPFVFTHNDYRSNNIMITEPNDELIICDFDLSTYGYRGHDFVSIIRECGSKEDREQPLERFFVDDSEFIQLFEIYVNECENIFGKSYSENPINCVKHIIKEVKTFMLYRTLFAVIHSMRNDPKVDFAMKRKLCMELAEVYLKKYFTQKKFLIKQNVIKSIN